jgi:hypothetical protein
MTMRKIMLALGLAGSAHAQPPRVIEARPDLAPAARGGALLRQAMLEGHNAARAALGQPALVWDDGLARDAKRYAQVLARTGNFRHAIQPKRDPQGENLWTGTRGAYAYAEMIGHWVDERRMWKRGVTPDFATTGRWEDVAHYTQIVWRGTTRVGCALASNRSDDYLVCRYAPPGNVVGMDGLRG